MVRPALLCLALAASSCATTTTAFYPLDELRALDGPENAPELLARAPEVAPSQRKDEWRGLVERAAVASLAQLEVKSAGAAERTLSQVDELLVRFPALQRSAPFLARRADVGVASFGWVLQGSRSQDWTRRVLDFARRDATTPHLAQRLAEEVVLKHLIAETALPLYELALEREGAAVCDSPGLRTVTLAVLAEGSPFPAATGPCWKQLEAPLVEAVKKAETRTTKLQLCAALAPQAAVPAVKAACAE